MVPPTPCSQNQFMAMVLVLWSRQFLVRLPLLMKTSTKSCEEQGSTKYILGSWAYCSPERVRPCEGTVGTSLPEGPTGSASWGDWVVL